jgi:hypothetical protein
MDRSTPDGEIRGGRWLIAHAVGQHEVGFADNQPCRASSNVRELSASYRAFAHLTAQQDELDPLLTGTDRDRPVYTHHN